MYNNNKHFKQGYPLYLPVFRGDELGRRLVDIVCGRLVLQQGGRLQGALSLVSTVTSSLQPFPELLFVEGLYRVHSGF